MRLATAKIPAELIRRLNGMKPDESGWVEVDGEGVNCELWEYKKPRMNANNANGEVIFDITGYTSRNTIPIYLDRASILAEGEGKCITGSRKVRGKRRRINSASERGKPDESGYFRALISSTLVHFNNF